jgi:hypothetical protein
MDIGEIEARIPAVSDINEQIVEFTKDYVKQKLSDMLTLISVDENLPRDKLMLYIHKIDFDDITSTIANSKKVRKTLDTEHQCKAKTSKGIRCTRKKKNGSYCGSHINSRPYGEITTDITPTPTETKIKPVIKLKVSLPDE